MTLLHAQALTLTNGHRRLCHDLTLQVQPGDCIGILGANGCGKTTLLHALAGLRQPQSGQILLKNTSLPSYSARELARYRGILFQSQTTTLPLTVIDYCLAARYPHHALFSAPDDAALQHIMTTLDQVELAGYAAKPVTHLSGGEKRRLAIASLLIQAPTLYLLDEPTNHLDLKHQIKILTHFKQLTLNGKTAVIMSLHDPQIAERWCTHVLLMLPDGETAQGTPHDMLTEANLSRLYNCRVTRQTTWCAI